MILNDHPKEALRDRTGHIWISPISTLQVLWHFPCQWQQLMTTHSALNIRTADAQAMQATSCGPKTIWDKFLTTSRHGWISQLDNLHWFFPSKFTDYLIIMKKKTGIFGMNQSSVPTSNPWGESMGKKCATSMKLKSWINMCYFTYKYGYLFAANSTLILPYLLAGFFQL